MVDYETLALIEATLFELYESKGYDKTRTAIELALDEIEKRIKRAGDLNTKKRLMEIRAAIKQYIIEAYGEVSKSIVAEMVESAGAVYGAVTLAQVPDRVIKTITSSNYLVQGYTVAELFGDLSRNHANALKVLLGSYVAQGASLATIIDDMREKSLVYTEKKLATAVRTTIKTARETARHEGYKEIEKDGYIVGYEYSAKLDSRTSDICRRLDGKRWKGDLKSVKSRPPLHFNCRSVLVPLIEGEDTAPEETYKDFFEKQNEEFKKLVLGDKYGKVKINSIADVKKAGQKLDLETIKNYLLKNIV